MSFFLQLLHHHMGGLYKAQQQIKVAELLKARHIFYLRLSISRVAARRGMDASLIDHMTLAVGRRVGNEIATDLSLR